MAATVRRDSDGGALETYSRWRNRRNGMGNVMQGVRTSHLRTLSSSLNHVLEHDTNDRTGVAPPATTVPETNVPADSDIGLSAILGFPVHNPTPESSVHEDHVELKNQSSDGDDSGEERERILRSPVHKRRRNALANALAVVDEESLHRIRRLHGNGRSAHPAHER